MSHRVKMLGGVAFLALMVAGGACADPAGVSTDANASTAAYDGGHTFGSGNAGTSDSGAASTQSDSTQRGGVLIGSGH